MHHLFIMHKHARNSKTVSAKFNNKQFRLVTANEQNVTMCSQSNVQNSSVVISGARRRREPPHACTLARPARRDCGHQPTGGGVPTGLHQWQHAPPIGGTLAGGRAGPLECRGPRAGGSGRHSRPESH